MIGVKIIAKYNCFHRRISCFSHYNSSEDDECCKAYQSSIPYSSLAPHCLFTHPSWHPWQKAERSGMNENKTELTKNEEKLDADGLSQGILQGRYKRAEASQCQVREAALVSYLRCAECSDGSKLAR